jgi:tetratricopeptide (TPR) repeat protein
MSSNAPTPGTPEAAPADPAGPPPSEAEVIVAEIEALRRKVDEGAALLRRNQLALSELADSVGKLVAQQRRRERSFTLNSFVAYLIFTVLLGGAFFALYQNRADELVSDRDRARDERRVANRKADDLAAELAARDKAAADAHAYWKLLEEGQRDKAIAEYSHIQSAPLTPTERDVFAAREKQARADIVDAGYLTGLDAYRAGKFAEAIPELKRALGYEEEGPRAAQMRYFLGVAMIKTGAPADGIKQLELALAGRVEQSGVADARFWLATAFEKLQRLEEARAEYDRFATANPRHPLSVAARRKSAALARLAKPRN